ncbi:vWA domain-containing protein [Pseudomonas sp. nanlin1]|uniref:vWA domain-containing protein n=1 Tax=Pseudomonas sp. nanlin1 TaxID=3040605 RepID=UPI00389116DE
MRPSVAPRADAGAGRGRQGQARAAEQGRIDWLATLLAGRPRQLADLRWQQRRASAHESWLVIVDASASTLRHGALAAAKGVLEQFFDDAYQQRARLTLLTASGRQPSWQRHGLKASMALQPWLKALGGGGGTPLAEALVQAHDWLQRRRKAYPEECQRCLILTDGRVKQLPAMQPLGCDTLLLDIERGAIRLGKARLIAQGLGAQYRHVDGLC